MNKIKTGWNDFIAYAFVVLCSFFTSFTASDNPLIIGNTGIDSSVFNYVARVILGGGMPYLDTFDHKGPLLYLINALGLTLNEHIGIWLMEFIFILIIFIFAYKIARRLSCGYFSSCATVLVTALSILYYFEGGNSAEEYSCAFIMISLYLFVKFFLTNRIKTFELIICGVSFAAVCLLKINLIVVWGVMCIAVLINRIKKNEAKDLIRFTIWFLFGALLITVPIMIWLMKNGAFDSFIQDYFLFNFMYTSDDNRASLINIISSLYLFCIREPMLIAIPILSFFCIYKNKILDWLVFISIIFSLFSMSISGQTFGHYGMMLCPLITYAIARFFYYISLSKGQWEKREFYAIVSSIAIIIVLFFARGIFIAIGPFQYLPFREARAIATVVRENTEENDKISVCGNYNIIYLLSDRKSVSKYSYQYPIAQVSKKIRQEYIDDLKTLDTSMILISDACFLREDIYKIMGTNYDKIVTIGKTAVYLKRKS